MKSSSDSVIGTMPLLLLITSLCLSGPLMADADVEEHVEQKAEVENEPVMPPPFPSWFLNLKEGRHIGKASGLLVVAASLPDEANGNTVTTKHLLPLEGGKAELNLIPDEHEIYDVSTKVYSTPVPNGNFVYKTYNRANALELKIGGDTYEYSVIDGGCDEGMSSLRCKYIQDEKIEYLVLVVEKPIRLNGTKDNPGHAILKTGSVVVFSHPKPRSSE